MDPEKRDELLKMLRQQTGDQEVDHAEFDRKLIAALGDAELTAAWEEASEHWWWA